MATIRKRGQKYQVQVRRNGHRSITRSFHTFRDADAWARQTEVQADRRELPPDPNRLRAITLGQLITRYKDTVSIRKKTRDRERIMLDALLRRPICSLCLSDLRTEDFAAYRDERLREVKPSSVARELAPVRHMFEIARKEWGIPLRQNPLAQLSIMGADPRRERRLRDGELARLLAAAKGSRNRYLVPIILFALVTGMRRGEILALKWRDIDRTARSLLIPSSKNGYPRVIPLLPEAIQVIAQLPRSGERVFPVAANALRLAWERLRRRAGLADLRFHDLRHEAISRFFEAGLSTAEVALISGHRDARMLFRYTHPLRERILLQLGSRSMLAVTQS
jgi:integrase